MKFIVGQLLFLLLCVFVTKTKTLPRNTRVFNKDESIIDQIVNSSTGRVPEAQTKAIEELTDAEAAAEEAKKEVSVSELLETANEPAVIAKELHHVPQYELDWEFIDKETIRVKFDLYYVPSLSVDSRPPSQLANDTSKSITNTTLISPSSSRSLALINALQYYIFIIRHYETSKERSLEMGRLIRKETRANRKYFATTVLLTALNRKEKYSVCLCYYQHNLTTQTPDLLLCQDIINDYAKFGHIRTNPRHGLIFILTQYSIILALLIVLQSLYTLRNRRFAQYIQKHVMQKAHSIRTTLSNVSLVRQSFSSLDTAAEQHNQANITLANQHEPTINEMDGTEKNVMMSPPNIIVSEPTVTPSNSDEKEPFLKQIPSKNHVHFLLGPGETSDDDDDNLENEDERTIQPQTNTEPYGEQSDAMLSMAHILDTNKPWSRHPHHSAPE